MSWLSGLAATVSPASSGEPADFALGETAQRKAQEIELLARRAIEEIALVAVRIGALVELGAALAHNAPHIMAGGEAIGAKLAREGDQVGELHPLVAQAAWHRRPARRIFVGEAVDHAGPEAAFIVEHIMGDAEPVGDVLAS